MRRFTITRPLGPEQIDYHNVGADSPLEALNRLHAEALGTKALRLEGDRLVFADPADRELYAGALGGDRRANHRSRHRRDDGEIAAVDPVDGRQAA
jgi:hypothetical protein